MSLPSTKRPEESAFRERALQFLTNYYSRAKEALFRHHELWISPIDDDSDRLDRYMPDIVLDFLRRISIRDPWPEERIPDAKPLSLLAAIAQELVWRISGSSVLHKALDGDAKAVDLGVRDNDIERVQAAFAELRTLTQLSPKQSNQTEVEQQARVQQYFSATGIPVDPVIGKASDETIGETDTPHLSQLPGSELRAEYSQILRSLKANFTRRARDPEAVEELIQQSIFSVCTTKYVSGQSLKEIARLLFDEMRGYSFRSWTRDRQRTKHFQDGDESHVSDQHFNSPVDGLIHHDNHERLKSAVLQLPPKLREVIIADTWEPFKRALQVRMKVYYRLGNFVRENKLAEQRERARRHLSVILGPFPDS